MTDTRSIPLSALELSAAVREGRSYDAARLDRLLRVDEGHGMVEVQASTPWKTIAAATTKRRCRYTSGPPEPFRPTSARS